LTVLISLEQVSRDFDNGRIVALRDVNLVVAKAESVAIVGASGSGKTTLIMLMCGIMLPSAGVIRWRGTPVTTPKAWTGLRRTEIGIVFQDFNLFPTLMAVENVEVPMLGTLNHSCERKRRANDVLEAVGLGERGYHLSHQLSGGERQRVAIARSLVNHPTLLLADEPTGNLDSISGTAIMDLLFDLQRSQGVTFVLVTHNANHARRCRQQIQIQDGRVFEKALGRLREVAK
jgi:predicted ABC-type transport system involved in lysophospholipase L1 biosynthesis ATPase subunit